MKLAVAAVALVAALSASAQVKVTDEELTSAIRGAITPLTSCYAGTANCGQTLTGRVSVDSCNSSGLYAVGYSFNGVQGNRITITGRSFEFAATVFLADGRSGNTTIYARHDVYSDGATAMIKDFVLPYTGPYFVMITPGVKYEFGDYVLTVSCQTANTYGCTSTSTNVCLLDGRFRVSISYVNPFSNPPNQPGTFVGARLMSDPQNPDAGIFGFSSPQAVEVMVRVQDTRPFANRFDVYYGGMTDVGYLVTVTDMKTGSSRNYVNPVGKIGGGVDRTSFPAN